MAPRGGRTKRCAIAGHSRAGGSKRPSGFHPGNQIKAVSGTPPTYRQTTLSGQRGIQSASPTHQSSSLPTDQSSAFRQRGAMSSENSQQSAHTRPRTSIIDEIEPSLSEHDGDEVDDDDVEATESDSLHPGSSRSVRVRGPDRAISPRAPGVGKLRAFIYMDKVMGHGVERFFNRQMKKKIEAFWPHFTDVDQVLKDQMWESFLDIYQFDDDVSLGAAREIFEIENTKRFSDFLSKAKTHAIESNKVEDVKGLIGTPCPHWCGSPAVWAQYVQYWCEDNQIARSTQARSNRLSSKDRPDGKPSVHALGSKSLRKRMFEQHQKTGKTPSPLPILLELNQKKNKVTNEPTGEFYNPKLVQAYEEYNVLYKEQFGSNANPLEQPWNKELWMQTEPVKSGLRKGRMLGAGTSRFAKAFMEDDDVALSNSSSLGDLKNENQELKQELADQKEELTSVKGELDSLKDMMKPFMALTGGGGSVGSIPLVGNAATASGLLASFHAMIASHQFGASQPVMHPPERQLPQPAFPSQVNENPIEPSLVNESPMEPS